MNIETTKEYDSFSILEHNRKIRTSHIAELKKSFKKKNLQIPIIVNEKGQIIDGQHRFMALRELGKPIPYIVIPKTGLEDVKILNTTQKNWTNLDYLHSYANRGFIEYVKIRDFMRQYKWNLSSMMALGRIGIAKNVAYESKSGMEVFRNGEFKVNNWEEAHSIANQIESLRKYLTDDIIRQVVFMRTMIKLIRFDKFDFKHFYNKLSYQFGSFQKKGTVNEYLQQIDEIYNFRERGEKYSFYQNLKIQG